MSGNRGKEGQSEGSEMGFNDELSAFNCSLVNLSRDVSSTTI
jgi:hypothetical protein